MGNIRVRLKIEVGIESQNRDVGVEKGPRGDSKVTKITWSKSQMDRKETFRVIYRVDTTTTSTTSSLFPGG